MTQQQQQIGPYQIQEELGRGGMGVVFRCLDSRTGEEVAVKVLTAHGNATEGQIMRFRREVQALAELFHPNLVRLRDAGEHRGTPYMVLDYVRGRDLQARIEQAGPLLPWVAARILRKVSEALQIAHERGLVHRDIKPANIMLGPQNEPILLDFGLVRSMDLVLSRVTKTGVFVGTPGFWSPEQAASKDVGPPTDVYSLGATLYSALTGRPPYTGANLLQIIDAMQQPIPPPSELAPGKVDPRLDAVVMRCLETDPTRRFPDAGALTEALDEFLSGERPAPAPLRRRRSPLPFALIGVSAALVVIGGVFLARGGGASPGDPPQVGGGSPVAPPPPLDPSPPTGGASLPTPVERRPPPRVAPSLRLQDRQACELARREILRGVEGLPQKADLTPGPVFTFGPRAFPVLTALSRRPTLTLPLVAAAFHGEGRVVAIGHDGYWEKQKDKGNGWGESAEARLLLENCIRWLNRGRPLPQVRVALTAPTDLENLLRELGCQVEILSIQEPDLSGVGLVIMPSDTEFPMSEESVAALVEFVEGGGGLFASATGWGTQQIFERSGPYELRRDFPTNRVLAPMGMVYGSGTYLYPHSEGRFVVARSRTEKVHAGDSLEDLFADSSLPPGDRRRAVTGVIEAAKAVTPADQLLIPRLRQLLASADTPRAPTLLQPVTVDDASSNLKAALLVRELEDLRPQEVEAAPGVDVFPGAVPQKARRESRVVEANPATRWTSTGLYAAAGEVITVRRAEAARGWRVRIGCHVRDLWSEETWKRWPQISHSWELRERETQVASPFGGLVYLEPSRLGDGASLTFTIEGVVAAPEFVLGDRDSERDWPASRDDPAPWGELRGRRVVLTLPSDALRSIGDPGEILRLWDSLLDQRDTFARPDPAQPDPVFRLVFDVQISGTRGLLATGYPSYYRLDEDGRVPAAVLRFDLSEPRGWDGYKLLAAYRMHGNWTWRAGTFGVNELVAQWLYSERTGRSGWRATQWYGPALEQRSNGSASLARQPALGGLLFAELQEEFGWEAFRGVLAQFARTKPAGSDALKSELWVLLLSRATGRNLIPYFERYGVTASPASHAVVAELPPWVGPR